MFMNEPRRICTFHPPSEEGWRRLSGTLIWNRNSDLFVDNYGSMASIDTATTGEDCVQNIGFKTSVHLPDGEEEDMKARRVLEGERVDSGGEICLDPKRTACVVIHVSEANIAETSRFRTIGVRNNPR
jgi:hypothetical protein